MHTAALRQEWLEQYNIEMMRHPLYSLDLVPCDFWLFSSLKCELCTWNFETNAQGIQETKTIFGCIPEEFETTIKKWAERIEACLAANGWYFKKENDKCMDSESEDDAGE